MPTRIQAGWWYQQSLFVRTLTWQLSQTLGCICYVFDLLKWLLSGSGTITEELGWKGLWHDVIWLWWSSVDRSNRWIGKTMTVIQHTPGDYQ
jgi:hypothetical protein